MIARIVLLNRGWASLRELPGAGTFLIGRADHCNLRIDDTQVSRVHALLRLMDERITLEDCGSKNGTRLRGSWLTPGDARDVGVGDCVRMGSSVLLIVGLGEEGAHDGAALDLHVYAAVEEEHP